MQMPMALSEHCSVLSWCSSPWYRLQTSNVPLKLIAIYNLLRVNFRENEEKHFACYHAHLGRER